MLERSVEYNCVALLEYKLNIITSTSHNNRFNEFHTLYFITASSMVLSRGTERFVVTWHVKHQNWLLLKTMEALGSWKKASSDLQTLMISLPLSAGARLPMVVSHLCSVPLGSIYPHLSSSTLLPFSVSSSHTPHMGSYRLHRMFPPNDQKSLYSHIYQRALAA